MLTSRAANIDRIGVMFDAIDPYSDHPFPSLPDIHTGHTGTPGADEFLPYRFPADDFPGWMLVAIDPRGFLYGDADHEAMDETNYAVVSETIGEVYRFPWYDWTDADIARAHGVGALVTDGVLLVSPAEPGYETDQSDRIDALVDLARALNNYPLLDDESYYQREAEAWNDFAADGLRYDTVRDLAGTLPDETVDAIDDGWDAILPVAMQYTDAYYGFTGEVSPDFTVCVARAMVGAVMTACTFGARTIRNSEVCR